MQQVGKMPMVRQRIGQTQQQRRTIDVGRLGDAAAQVAEEMQQARRERNAMALDTWTTIDGMVHLAAGDLPAARAATESLPPPQPTGATELDMVRTVILAEVAVRRTM